MIIVNRQAVITEQSKYADFLIDGIFHMFKKNADSRN